MWFLSSCRYLCARWLRRACWWQATPKVIGSSRSRDPGTDGVAVKANHEVEDRGPVADLDFFLVGDGRLDFFRKIKGIVIALLKGEVGQIGQLSQGDLLAVSQRIVAA